MPHYYFDVHDKDGIFHDEVGLDLPDMETAITEARRALADMTKEMLIGVGAEGIQIIIHDGANGPVRLSVSLETTRLDGHPPDG